MTSYEPKEGVDYLVDLYAAVGVDRDVASEDVKKAINSKLLEYHPDRLQGLAPEFRSKGERMAKLLNRARVVLLDETKKVEYDSILTTWDGPISPDGTPVIRIADALREDAARKSPEELEAAFQAQSLEVSKMTKHNPAQQALLAKMLEQAGSGEDADALADAYDAALFAEDQVLAIEEAERGQLLGLAHVPRYELTENYAAAIENKIEDARTRHREEHKYRALGGVSKRLELLAGDFNARNNTEMVPVSSDLPAYYDEQAKKVTEIAAKREALLEKRLGIFQPTYPVLEVQKDARPNVAVGIESKGTHMWLAFSFDPEAFSMDAIDIDEIVEGHLRSGEFGMAYSAGYNVLTFEPKEQIKLTTLLNTALSKYIAKFYPKSNED